LSYGTVTDISPDIKLVLANAGHILGSASCHFHIGNGDHNFVYSGDIKYGKSMLLESADTRFPRVETLLGRKYIRCKRRHPAYKRRS